MMLRLAKAFWDIALWRRSPAQLPASLFLLGLVAAAVAILEVLGALLPPGPSDRIFTRVILSVGLPLVFAWAVLAIAHHRQRFLQTGIALLGVAVLAQLVLYPLGSLLNVIGSDRPASIPLGLLLFVGLIWYLLACANIWRSALDSGIGVGIAVSVGYLLLSMVLEQQLLPDA
jgi:L-asparagine transporter-like permease